MELKPKTERLDARIPEAVARAATLLRQGGTVAFPTETVYGLGADALSIQSVAKIFAAKQRPAWDPLIVHVCDARMLAEVAASISPLAESLMAKFWPGPLTLLLPRTNRVPDAVTAGRPLVGVRLPAHPVALELIRQAGVPIAAPSANIFGHTSPTTAAHVLADLDGRIDAVLDGGPTEVGLESTVAEVTPDGLLIYRPGAVTLAMLEAVAGRGNVRLYIAPDQSLSQPEALPSPGVGLRHYAPAARLILVEPDQSDPTHSLLPALSRALEAGGKVGAMLPGGWAAPPGVSFFPWGDWAAPEVLAHRLFDGLRTLDDQRVDTIVCPVPPGAGIEEAIRDRLRKASQEK